MVKEALQRELHDALRKMAKTIAESNLKWRRTKRSHVTTFQSHSERSSTLGKGPLASVVQQKATRSEELRFVSR